MLCPWRSSFSDVFGCELKLSKIHVVEPDDAQLMFKSRHRATEYKSWGELRECHFIIIEKIMWILWEKRIELFENMMRKFLWEKC